MWWFWVSIPFAIGGAVVARRRRIPLLPLLGPLVMVTLVAAIFWGSVRFRVPAEVPIVVLVAIALDARLPRFVLASRAAK